MIISNDTARDFIICLELGDPSTTPADLSKRLAGSTRKWASDDSSTLRWDFRAAGRPPIRTTFQFDSYDLLEEVTASCDGGMEGDAKASLDRLSGALRGRWHLPVHHPRLQSAWRTRLAAATAKWPRGEHEELKAKAEQTGLGSAYWRLSVSRTFAQPMARDRLPPTLDDLFA